MSVLNEKRCKKVVCVFKKLMEMDICPFPSIKMDVLSISIISKTKYIHFEKSSEFGILKKLYFLFSKYFRLFISRNFLGEIDGNGHLSIFIDGNGRFVHFHHFKNKIYPF